MDYKEHTDKPGDGAFAAADHGELLAVFDVVNCDPADNAGGSRGVGVECCEEGAETGVQSRASVEAEPAEPDKDL
jgi:hypothetical protein